MIPITAKAIIFAFIENMFFVWFTFAIVIDFYKELKISILKYTESNMKSKLKSIPTPNDVKYIQDTLYVVGGKWKLPILYSLSIGALRFGDLKEKIPNITSRMLSKELKELELNGFIKRDCHNDSIEYTIADYCKSFERIIKEIIDWGKEHRKHLSLKEYGSL